MKITFVEVGDGAGYVREERSDDEIHVTRIAEGQIGPPPGSGRRAAKSCPVAQRLLAGGKIGVTQHEGSTWGSAPAELALAAKLGLDLLHAQRQLTDVSSLGVGPDGERGLVAWPACTG